ncbi:hypothetical protein WA1_23125 [Scytonema hofmannii PCC 7110]|uniref:Uncharacterized protein n=1 Tax=Scytonema hofmannii PCC 7110 TaxID=128403 RepID=A0A139X8Q9_9CYAN|nr:hypothetical protein [Scytonema hofmannii]KYC41022.1 hypothetical protein WA1_23125 [Scytonema hofmannii PCC 7110]
MNQLNHLSQRSIELVETIWATLWVRLLIVLLATLLSAIAGPGSALNPDLCPGFLYREPYNHRVLVPQSCPPNTITQQQLARAQSPNQFEECSYTKGLSCSIASVVELQ